ncbi:2OG-Fe(II) oxygenase [Alteromonas sp. a30]|uniref:2OG-Fe(II) oxygenase n=1 Tax=Alteromonas sp. a30 TaxID=2730917 RepID=UPI0022825C31|nr:2OG-Fe(II) oxygenase [Alteromonas sp. a30]MCY7295534.1 2OG-Fe(II) oxygenase [Alteromonas sp. a30]
MNAIPFVNASNGNDSTNDALFNQIANDLRNQGYSIKPNALPETLANALLQHQYDMDDSQFKNAGIGRGDKYLKTDFVRTDEICWITGDSEAGQEWLKWASALQSFLNRRLFLGLFSFESHFAHYAPGDFYKRHYDAFKGEANRVLSLVTYLNPDWQQNAGGELVLYRDEHDREGIKVTPLHGTIVAFLSEDFPHEVLPATRDRFSIAGWFRINTSIAGQLDPPS